jgi:hypothetical protein
VKPLDADRLTAAQWAEFSTFCSRMSEAHRSALGTEARIGESQNRLDHVRKAILETPAVDPALLSKAQALHGVLKDLHDLMQGDAVVASRQEPTLPGVLDRLLEVIGSVWGTTQLPTASQRQNLAWAEDGHRVVRTRLDQALTDLKALENALEAAKAPYTPGRPPR